MKKIKEPNLKVIKFESMDVIATSDNTGKVEIIRSANTATVIVNDIRDTWK